MILTDALLSLAVRANGPCEPWQALPSMSAPDAPDEWSARPAWAPPDLPPRRRRWWLWLLPVALVVALLVFPVRYVLIQPGSARDIDPLITVAKSHDNPPKGDFMLLSVSVGETRVMGEALAGWLDKNVDVYTREQIFGKATNAQQFQEQNVAAMSDSKQVATYVALRSLGYPATEVGEGAFVNEVDSTVPVADSLRHGDVIVEADGRRIELMSELVGVITAHKPGDTITLRVKRKGANLDLVAPLVERDGRTIMGVSIETANQRFTYPFDVAIDSQNIGGPSAGLAFTLALIDRLTPGELTGGNDVAVTGTIAPNGAVGPVGGLRQKTLSARRSGADLMLVPESEVAEAKKYSGAMAVRGVASVSDAMQALETLKGSNAAEVQEAMPSAA